MQEAWSWLGGDSSLWDAIGTIGVALIVIGLAIAAVWRARTVIAQSKSGSSHRETANHATETRVAFAGRETFPNIMIGAATTREGEIIKDKIALLNMGGGTAKDLRLRCLDESHPYEIPLEKQLLVVKDILRVPFNNGRSAASRFQLTFRTDFGTQFALEFEWDGDISEASDERLTVISQAPISPGT